MGKHDGLAQIEHRYSFIFEAFPIKRFVVFGIVRKPVDFVLSVYNTHSRDAFDNMPQSTKGLSFDDFWNTWRHQHGWMLVPQHQRFLDSAGELAVNFIVHFDRIGTQIPQMFREAYGVELPLEIEHVNVSPKVSTVDQLRPEHIRDIEDFYVEDERILRESTGVWLGAHPDIDPEIQARLRHDIERRIVLAKEIAEFQRSRLTLPGMQQRIRRLEGEMLAWRKMALGLGVDPEWAPVSSSDPTDPV